MCLPTATALYPVGLTFIALLLSKIPIFQLFNFVAQYAAVKLFEKRLAVFCMGSPDGCGGARQWN